MWSTTFQFYRSVEWEKFRRVIIAERRNEKGDTIDEVTGKPIVNAYDIILHHKIPITDINVNDYNVSLNPENVMIVSHKTHNNLHKRFGTYDRHVYIVYGSPCAGKSTFVNERALSDDLIIDIDRIYEAITNDRSIRVYDNVMSVYRSLIDMVKTRYGRWCNCWVVRTFPLKGERERLAKEIDGELIFIDTPKEVCMDRAKVRSAKYPEYVEDWWRKFQSD